MFAITLIFESSTRKGSQLKDKNYVNSGTRKGSKAKGSIVCRI